MRYFAVLLIFLSIFLVKIPKANAALCDTIADPAKKAICTSTCSDDKKVWTALGCLSTDLPGIMKFVLPTAIGIAGGIAMLLIIFGGYQVMTSAGNPEQLHAGQELISSTISGLLMIIFSVFILKFIGVDFFCIPGFNSC